MSLKQFRFTIENTLTHERTAFIGDGYGISDALKDGMKCVQFPSSHRGDGGARPPLGLAVHLRSGEIVNRALEQFEGDVAHGAASTPASELDFPI